MKYVSFEKRPIVVLIFLGMISPLGSSSALAGEPDGDDASEDRDSIRNHSAVVVSTAAAGLVDSCFVEIEYVSSGYIGDSSSYELMVVVDALDGSDSRDIEVTVNEGTPARDEGRWLAEVIVEQVGFCWLPSIDELIDRENPTWRQGIEGVGASAATMEDVLSDIPDDDPARGRLIPPAMIVTEDEAILVSPVDPWTQRGYAKQLDRGLPESDEIYDQADGETPERDEYTLGDPNFLQMTMSAYSTGFDKYGNGFTDVKVDLGVFNAFEIDMMYSRWNGNWYSNSEKYGAEATIQLFSEEFFSLDEETDRSYEGAGAKLIEDHQFWRQDWWFPTVIGPVHIYVRILGNVGYEPYGLSISEEGFNFYFRPYASLDAEFWGGVDYFLTWAGIAGRVVILSGTLALEGYTEDRDDDLYACGELRLAELTALSGEVYLDVSDARDWGGWYERSQDQLVETCERIAELGGGIYDWVEAVDQGLIDLEDQAGDLKSFKDDLTEGIGAAADGVSQGANHLQQGIATVAPAAEAVSGWFGYRQNPSNWSDAIQDLPEMDCEEVVENLDKLSARIYHKIYDWEGMKIAQDHTWYRRCYEIGD